MSVLTENRATILAVDDNDANRYALVRTLSRAGFTVLEAATGREALELVRRQPDLIVLDVGLPDMDGYEVCRRLRSSPAGATALVIQMSASFVDLEDRVRG